MYKFDCSKTSMVIDLTGEDSDYSTKTGIPVKSNGIVRPTNFKPLLAGPRKFVVKNLKPAAGTDPELYLARALRQLDDAFETILVRNERPVSMEELYKSVENLCRQGKAQEVTTKLQTWCRKHVVEHVREELRSVAKQGSTVQTLKATVDAWSLWRKQMATIKSVFLYLNQSYLISSKSDPTIDELCTLLFQVQVFEDDQLHQSIVVGACELVAMDRAQIQTLAFDRPLFKQAVEMFHDLKVYTKSFEPKLLGDSQEFFRLWSDKQVESLGLPSYVSACDDLIRREEQRCDEFNLDGSTRRNIRGQFESFLVDSRVEYLTKPADVAYLMGEDDYETLRSLYELLQRKGHGSKLRLAFEQYVEATGEAIIFDEKREQEMVPRLLTLKRNLDKILEECFKKETDLGIGMREGFRRFINKTKKTDMTWGTDNEKPGEMIAKYVDMLLRGGVKAIQDDADEDTDVDGDVIMNHQLDQVLELFRFLNGKAVFEAFYKKDLAKRLLLKQSANDRAEKSMLERLKNECGANFTSNLEQMFKDIDLSRDENAAFKIRRQERGLKIGPDLEVNILEASAWPSYPNVPIEIPQAIQEATKAFEDHYQSHHTGRKLEWKHDRAFCQLNARFDRNYVVVVSAFQAIVLLYFNDKDPSGPVGFSELRAATKLSQVDLVRTLQSLACARYKVLRKSSKGPEVSETDTFTVNTSFRSEKVRIKINQIQLKETKEENKATHERVAQDREFETQAAIVRIMKSEQKIRHQQLVVKVIEALAKRGAVSPEDIKKQIDKLIDKDYMDRIDDNMYEYVA